MACCASSPVHGLAPLGFHRLAALNRGSCAPLGPLTEGARRCAPCLDGYWTPCRPTAEVLLLQEYQTDMHPTLRSRAVCRTGDGPIGSRDGRAVRRGSFRSTSSLPGAMHIGRGRRGGIAGIGSELPFQNIDAISQRPQQQPQLVDERLHFFGCARMQWRFLQIDSHIALDLAQ